MRRPQLGQYAFPAKRGSPQFGQTAGLSIMVVADGIKPMYNTYHAAGFLLTTCEFVYGVRTNNGSTHAYYHFARAHST